MPEGAPAGNGPVTNGMIYSLLKEIQEQVGRIQRLVDEINRDQHW